MGLMHALNENLAADNVLLLAAELWSQQPNRR